MHKIALIGPNVRARVERRVFQRLHTAATRGRQSGRSRHTPDRTPRQITQIGRAKSLCGAVRLYCQRQTLLASPGKLSVVMNLATTASNMSATPIPGHKTRFQRPGTVIRIEVTRPPPRKVGTIHLYVNARHWRNRPPPMLSRSIQLKTVWERREKSELDLTVDSLPQWRRALCDINQ